MNASLPERFSRVQTTLGSAINSQDGHTSSSDWSDAAKRKLHEYFSFKAEDQQGWLSQSELPSVKELQGSGQSLQSSSWLDDTSALAPDQAPYPDSDQPHWTENDVNKIDGPWNSKGKYLETHYKLLRENALRPLREALTLVDQIRTVKEDPSHATLGIYEGVFISGFTFSEKGIGAKISFTLNRVGKNILWKQSKRLITGSLVVLVPLDDIMAFKVATVAARPIEGLECSPPEVHIYFARPDDIEIDTLREYVMIEERSGYFEAERYTLMALQKMTTEK